MLVLRDNYYSSPLIIDEDEYLEKMFAALTPLTTKQIYRRRKQLKDMLKAEQGLNLREMMGQTRVDKFGNQMRDFTIGNKVDRDIHNFNSAVKEGEKIMLKHRRREEFREKGYKNVTSKREKKMLRALFNR